MKRSSSIIRICCQINIQSMNKTLLLFYFIFFTLIANAQTADFTYQTTDGLFCSPTDVQFTQTATGSPKGFVWTFGNGEGSNSPNPEVTYKNAGSYTVKLIVIYARTTVVVTKSITINPSITVSIGYDRNYICKSGSINFTATSNGNIAEYDWDFGDGQAETTAATNIAHNYTAEGIYNVTLKAVASSGCSGTTQTTVSVKKTPIAGNVSPNSGCVPAKVNFNTTASNPCQQFNNRLFLGFR